MAANLTVPFSGLGGTAPYTYSVLPGGAGGTIDSSTGLYASPQNLGIDTIQTLDAVGDKALSQILVGTPLELVCDIIQNQMRLRQGQVYLWDQKISPPNDSRLYVILGVLTCKPFGNTNSHDADGNSIQSINMSTMLSIDIFSRGPAARDRKEEVLMALNSDYAESQQELNSFRVFPLSQSFVNLSEIEGAAIPYRFNVGVMVQYFVTKQNPINYYDAFAPVSVSVNA